MSELLWDPRLITRPEAYAMVSEWPVLGAVRKHKGNEPPRGNWLYLDCGNCGQAIITFGPALAPTPVTGDALVAAILRHMVMAHNVNLGRNRGSGRGDQPGRAAAGRGDGDRGAAVADPAADRQRDQEAGARREPRAAAGDRR